MRTRLSIALRFTLFAMLVVAAAASCRLFDFGSLQVVSYSPSADQLASLQGVTIQIRFNKSVNQSVTAQAFSVTANGSVLPGKVSWADDRTLLFTPFEPLQTGISYTMALTTQAEDINGVDLNAPFAHTFSTKTSYTRPTVLSASPADHASVSDQLSPITIAFSEAMSASTVESAFSISPSVTGLFSMSTDGTTLTFTPTQALQWQTQYAVTVGTGAADLQGNTLGAAFTTHFNVGTSTTQPTILSIKSTGTDAIALASPPTVTSGWEATDGFVITFSEPVQTSSAIGAVTISPSVQPTIQEQNTQSTTTLTYTFANRLAWGTTYSLSIASGVLDTQGNASTQSYAYYFNVNGTATQPPLVAGVYFLTNPATVFPTSGSPGTPVYQALSPNGTLSLDSTDFPPAATVPTETYFDLYFNVASGATLDPLAVGRAFSTNVTNNAVAITQVAVQIYTTNPTSPPIESPEPSLGAGQVLSRVYVDLTVNGSSTPGTQLGGVVTLELATSLVDSLGNALAQQYLLPLNSP